MKLKKGLFNKRTWGIGDCQMRAGIDKKFHNASWFSGDGTYLG